MIASATTKVGNLEAVVDLSKATLDVATVFQSLIEGATAGQFKSIGFPGAVDIDFSPVLPLFRRLWNNIGDPGVDPGGAAHTKVLERAVVDWCANALALPMDDRWGYVTAGGTDGNLAAIYAARRRFPGAVAYHSEAAHYSIPKILDLMGVQSVVVDADKTGEMDYRHLSVLLKRGKHLPAIVVATAGTTMTEAVDNTDRIRTVFEEHRIRRHHVHVDAALAGIPLALDGVLRLDQGSGIDSIAISGHKFFGTPIPCGIVLMRASARMAGQDIAYTATLDTTVAGSRCGQAAALLWYAVATHGSDGHRLRVTHARKLAAYATDRLNAIGWPAWRQPHAFTVVLRTPPKAVTQKWLLATEGDWSHAICMPGITQGQIDAFVADLAGLRRMVRDFPERDRQFLSARARKAETASRPGLQRSQRTLGATRAINSRQRVTKFVQDADANAQALGYRDVEQLLRATDHLTYRALGELMGWSAGQVYRWRLKYQIRSTAPAERAARRNEDRLAGLEALPLGEQPVDDFGRLRCRHCGRWFDGLAQHLQASHGITTARYRRDFGLSAGVQLRNGTSRRNRVTATRQRSATASTKAEP